MTTTKKKAKRSTRATGMAADVAEMGAEVVRLGRVSAALEGIYQVHMLSRFESLSRRIEALEQAQRSEEKPAAEKRAGPWATSADGLSVCRETLYKAQNSTDGKACGVVYTPDGRWRAWSVDYLGGHERALSWSTLFLTQVEAMHVCDEALRADGWTLEDPPAPTAPVPSEKQNLKDAVVEQNLKDAVVDAALAWFSAGEDLGPGQKQESMMTAIVALRAHRAKKGT